MADHDALDKLPFGRAMERSERQRDLALDCAEKAEAERDELREAGAELAEALRDARSAILTTIYNTQKRGLNPNRWDEIAAEDAVAALARWDALSFPAEGIGS